MVLAFEQKVMVHAKAKDSSPKPDNNNIVFLNARWYLLRLKLSL